MMLLSTILNYSILEFSLILSIIFLILLIILLCLFINKQKQRIKKINKSYEPLEYITKDINEGYLELVNNSDVGIITFDSNHRISFASPTFKDKFQQLLGNDPKNLLDIDEKLYNMILNEGTPKEDIIETIHRANNHIDYIYHVTKNNAIMYFYDVTEREKAKEDLIHYTTAIGFVSIDINEMVGVNQLTVNKIRADIYSKVEKYLDNYNCQICKLDDEHLVFLTNYYSLNQMCDNEFTIIKEVEDYPGSEEFLQKYEVSNELSTTISIGAASKVKASTLEIGNIAQQRLQLAINRGGNSACVKINDEVKQYGLNKVFRLKNTLENVSSFTSSMEKKCEQYNNIFIVSHYQADADALGSMIAAFRLFRLYTKGNVKIVVDYDNLEETTKKLYKYLLKTPETITKDYVPYKDVFITKEESLTYPLKDSLLIICDTQSPRLLMYPDYEKEFKEIIVIDHHQMSEASYVDGVEIFNDQVSSTVEIFLNMYRFSKKIVRPNEQDNTETYHITSEEANVMLTGIVVDTANFTYRTTNLTFQCVTTLSINNADMIFVRKILRDNIEYEKDISYAIDTADYSKVGFAIGYIESNNRTLIAKIADRLLTIVGIKASFSIGHYIENDKDYYILSARSYNDFNVENIFKDLGGGGHHQAAGCSIPNKVIDSITKEDIIKQIKEGIEITEGELVKVIVMKESKELKGKNLYDICEVADGYANKLIKDGIVERYTPKLAKDIEELKRKDLEMKENQRKIDEEIKKNYDGKTLTMTMKIGANGRSVGSDITTEKISKELQKQGYGLIDKKNISIEGGNKISSTGSYKIEIHISAIVKAHMTLTVIEG